MARCASDSCNRWRPEVIARSMSGIHVDGRWFCSQECFERTTKRLLLDAKPRSVGIPPVPPLKVGVLLRHQGAITADQLTRALEAQRETGLPIGAQLTATEAVDPRVVVRALAAQAGIRYLATVDVGAVLAAPGGLPRDAVRALAVVPFTEPDESGHIRVACAAPVPRAALAALSRLTGWSPEPYLVSDDAFAALLEAYGQNRRRPESRVSDFVRASSLADAATRIAAAAGAARRLSVTEARWAPYTWVRVQADGLTRDVLFDSGEHACQALSTSH